MSSITIIYATGSGHTEYVMNVLLAFWKKKTKTMKVTMIRAEEAKESDLLKGDILILGSGSWNTGGVEGQMHPYMYELLKGTAKDIDLKGKLCTVVALGDKRYFYTARAGKHMRSFIVTHGGKVLGQPLTIINEPYGQEEKIQKWGDKLLSLLKS